MASHRKHPAGTRGPGLRGPALATAAFTSVAVLSQSSAAQAAEAAPADDGRPSLEEIERKIDELYRQADAAPDEEPAARQRARVQHQAQEEARRARQLAKAREGQEGRAPLTADPDSAASLLAEFPRDHFAPSSVLNRLASRVKDAAERGERGRTAGRTQDTPPAGAAYGGGAGSVPRYAGDTGAVTRYDGDAGDTGAVSRYGGYPVASSRYDGGAGAPEAARGARVGIPAPRDGATDAGALPAGAVGASYDARAGVRRAGVGSVSREGGPVAGTSPEAVGSPHGRTVGSPYGGTVGSPYGGTVDSSHGRTVGSSHDATVGSPHGRTVGSPYGGTVGPSQGGTVGSSHAVDGFSPAATIGSSSYDVRAAKATVQRKLGTARELLSRLPAAEEAPSAGRGGPRHAAPASAPYAAASPARPVTKAAKAIAFARAQLGRPYVSGASGPGSYDASGLTQAAWKAAGVTLPRAARDQAFAGTPVPVADARPGDLVFFGEDDGHVGLCTGDGTMIHAPGPGAYVREALVDRGGESAVHRVVRPV